MPDIPYQNMNDTVGQMLVVVVFVVVVIVGCLVVIIRDRIRAKKIARKIISDEKAQDISIPESCEHVE